MSELAFIKSATTKQRALLTYSSEVEGFGRWPSGTIIGSGREQVGADGRVRGEWHGLLSTIEGGEFIRWIGTDQSVDNRKVDRGVMLMHFQTTSRKLSWMNDILVMKKHSGTAREFNGIGYELE
jgi:hypothetical protein